MTERQKRQIEAYIPSPRDESLDPFDYYIEDDYGKIHKVYIQDIAPHFEDDSTRYGVRYSATGKRCNLPWGTYGMTRKSDLYDNKEDCRNHTHYMCDFWEELRKLQKEEGNG